MTLVGPVIGRMTTLLAWDGSVFRPVKCNADGELVVEGGGGGVSIVSGYLPMSSNLALTASWQDIPGYVVNVVAGGLYFLFGSVTYQQPSSYVKRDIYVRCVLDGVQVSGELWTRAMLDSSTQIINIPIAFRVPNAAVGCTIKVQAYGYSGHNLVTGGSFVEYLGIVQ